MFVFVRRARVQAKFRAQLTNRARILKNDLRSRSDPPPLQASHAEAFVVNLNENNQGEQKGK